MDIKDIDISNVRFGRNYIKMIGFRDLTIEDAYKEYIKFLKFFKLFGTFKISMTKWFGIYAQLYKSYFYVRVYLIKEYVNIRNSLMKNRKINYEWYEDIELLFPFLPKDQYGFCFGQFYDTVFSLWLKYCTDYKLNYSEIIIKERPTFIESMIFKKCGYFPIVERREF